MTDLEKVQLLQEKIKADEVKVADFVKYAAANKQTFYNLRDDKVSPEKMTVKTASNLARCYDILFPNVGKSRDYRWGRVLGFLYFIHSLNRGEWEKLITKPNTNLPRIHSRMMEIEAKRMMDWEPELAAIMNTMDESDMTDERLGGMVMLGHGKELNRLMRMEQLQNEAD